MSESDADIFGIESTKQLGTCDNCHKEQVFVRRVLSVGMFGEKRRYWNLCYDCYPLHQSVKSYGRTYHYPISKEMIEE